MSAARLRDAFVDGAHAVADLQARCPRAVPTSVSSLSLGAASARRGEQDQQVDVGVREQLAAAVTADRHKRGVARHAGCVPDVLQRAVDEPRWRAQQPEAGGRLRGELCAQLRPRSGLQRAAAHALSTLATAAAPERSATARRVSR